jgi:hypothetical protein
MKDLHEIYDLVVQFFEKDENSIIKMADSLIVEGLIEKNSTRQSLFEEMQKIDLRHIDFKRISEIYNPVVLHFSDPLSEEIIKTLNAENRQVITNMRLDSGMIYAELVKEEVMKEVSSLTKEVGDLKNIIKDLVAKIEAQNVEIKMMHLSLNPEPLE